MKLRLTCKKVDIRKLSQRRNSFDCCVIKAISVSSRFVRYHMAWIVYSVYSAWHRVRCEYFTTRFAPPLGSLTVAQIYRMNHFNNKISNESFIGRRKLFQIV